MDKCPYCGAKTRPGDYFCLNCGNRLLSASPSYQQAQPDDGPEQEHSRRKASYDQIHVGEQIYERRRAESKLGHTRRILLMIGIPVLIILFVGALLLQITKQSIG